MIYSTKYREIGEHKDTSLWNFIPLEINRKSYNFLRGKVILYETIKTQILIGLFNYNTENWKTT